MNKLLLCLSISFVLMLSICGYFQYKNELYIQNNVKQLNNIECEEVIKTLTNNNSINDFNKNTYINFVNINGKIEGHIYQNIFKGLPMNARYISYIENKILPKRIRVNKNEGYNGTVNILKESRFINNKNKEVVITQLQTFE